MKRARFRTKNLRARMVRHRTHWRRPNDLTAKTIRDYKSGRENGAKFSSLGELLADVAH